jgi:Tol biopolymer transport system component
MSALAPGSRLGHYDVVDSLGAGGMGEVYRATDTRLKRQVALKVLPSLVTADPDRLARFQREAEVLASLNHPNIAALYGLEDSGGVRALVMELVEGPTLADRIAQGPIPIDEALAIARQIADALAAAHDQNVIHRDLKPANVKVRPDGTVKVLDFGLAKAMGQGTGIGDQGSGPTVLANSPTMTSPAMTMHGVILGTAAYMSPEQAAGRPVDRRTDLWAFGVVLMEMLTGRPVFAGDSVTDVIASVLKDEPDWKALPPSTPPSIQRLLRRCIDRDRKKRWPDAAAARMECDDALAPGGLVATSPGAFAAVGRSPWHLAGALVAGAALASALAWARWPAAAAPPVTRFEIELPDNRVFTRTGRHVVAVSHDGSQIAYVANRQIFIRAIDQTTVATLEGTVESDPSEPLFSPDGKWLAFWSDNQIKKIPVSGGTAVALSTVSNPYGMSWTGDRILVGVNDPPRILAVPADGGTVTTLVTLASDELAQTPQLVNDGRSVLFTLLKGDGPWQDATVVVQDLTSGARTVLVEHGTDARVIAAGYLVYERESTLFAIAFDEDRVTVRGSPVPVQTNVQEALGNFSGAAQAVVSSNGTLVFVPMNTAFSFERVLMWLDRNGVTERLPFPPAPHFTGRSQRLSPDGRKVASRIIGDNLAVTDLWVGELAQGIFRRITFTGRASDPVWSADGSQVCYEQQDEVLCQPADGSGAARSLFKWPRLNTLEERSPDGRWMLFLEQPDTSSRFNTRMVDMRSPSAIRQVPPDGAPARFPSLSPDGRFIAYVSGESAREDIYVRPFPAVSEGRWQIATRGDRPSWSPDGKELFYLAGASGGGTSDATLMRVPVRPGPVFSAGVPEPVVKLPPNAAFNFSVAADGRFLINVPAIDSSDDRNRLIVVQNWFEELKAKVPR